jgi:hypothetical protein
MLPAIGVEVALAEVMLSRVAVAVALDFAVVLDAAKPKSKIRLTVIINAFAAFIVEAPYLLFILRHAEHEIVPV